MRVKADSLPIELRGPEKSVRALGGQIGVKISCKSYKPAQARRWRHHPGTDRADRSSTLRGLPGFWSKVASGKETCWALIEAYAGIPPATMASFSSRTNRPASKPNASTCTRNPATALEKLRPRERQVIVGKYFEDKTLVDIGKEWKPEPVSGEWMRRP